MYDGALQIEGTLLENLLTNHVDPVDYFNYRQRLIEAVEMRDEYSSIGGSEYSESVYNGLCDRADELRERIQDMEYDWKSTTNENEINMEQEFEYIQYYVDHEDEFLDVM